MRLRPAQGALLCTLGSLPHGRALGNATHLSNAADPVPNAIHIFNAVHSAMHQWGSSLHHNGMSFCLITIPDGTQFYHGSDTPDLVTGMEWAGL